MRKPTVENKYHLSPNNIPNLQIADWDRLKEVTWHNVAMRDRGTWYCHLEGCNKEGQHYDDFDEFWIGFREEDDTIEFSFSANDGMCNYNIINFYDEKEIENEYDLRVQENAIKWLNTLIDEGILDIIKD